MSGTNCVPCPWCGGDLERGTFRSRGGNYFLPETENSPQWLSLSALKKKRAIPLPPGMWSRSPFAPDFPVAYLCRACKRIVIPYSETCFS